MSRWASESCISEAIRGDRPAVERLIEQIWPACFRLAAAMLGDRMLAQDAAQETCVIVYRKVHSIRSPAAFHTWIYRTAAHEIARIRRKHRRRDDRTQALADPSDTIALDVWNALDQLTAEMREVVVLFYFDDLSTIEIACALNVAATTVRTRLNRARERLRVILEEYQPSEPTETARA